MYRRSHILASGAGLIALLISAPAAMASESSLSGYAQDGGVVASQVAGGDAVPSAATATRSTAAGDGRSLPFTGADLELLAASGALMLGLGVGLRRVITPRPGARREPAPAPTGRAAPQP